MSHSPPLSGHHCQSPCDSPTPRRQSGHQGTSRGPGPDARQQTPAGGSVSPHSTADGLQDEELEGPAQASVCRLQTLPADEAWCWLRAICNCSSGFQLHFLCFALPNFPPPRQAREMDCAGCGASLGGGGRPSPCTWPVLACEETTCDSSTVRCWAALSVAALGRPQL